MPSVSDCNDHDILGDHEQMLLDARLVRNKEILNESSSTSEWGSESSGQLEAEEVQQLEEASLGDNSLKCLVSST
jgi:hypothetical protein